MPPLDDHSPLTPAAPPDRVAGSVAAPERRLGLWDAANLVVGIVVGTSIFRASTDVFQRTAGPWESLAAWGLGGALSLVGALCYAELATTYTRSGGDYEYLSKAYGRWAGFLFGWAQLVAVWTASVGTMAYSFGDYGVRLFGWDESATVWLAAAAVVSVAAINLRGLVAGKWTQNILTAAKVAGLTGVVIAGITAAMIDRDGNVISTASQDVTASGEGASDKALAIDDDSRGSGTPPANTKVVAAEGSGREGAPAAPALSFALAMVFVLYAYGGWNDAAFVAAEVREPRRNVPLALLGGVGGVTIIYLAVNAAYLAALGFEGSRHSKTPAADAVAATLGSTGSELVSVLVMISALGAINGMIFAGSRVFAVFGADHRAFAWLGRSSATTGAPVAAIVAQSAVTLAMIFVVGTVQGRHAIDEAFMAFGAPAVPWEKYYGGFETLLAASAPVFWSLFLAVGVALMVLRWRNPQRQRPFSVPLYPLPPLIFCGTCLFMLRASLQYAEWLTLLGAVPVAVGAILYLATRRRGRISA